MKVVETADQLPGEPFDLPFRQSPMLLLVREEIATSHEFEYEMRALQRKLILNVDDAIHIGVTHALQHCDLGVVPAAIFRFFDLDGLARHLEPRCVPM